MWKRAVEFLSDIGILKPLFLGRDNNCLMQEEIQVKYKLLEIHKDKY